MQTAARLDFIGLPRLRGAADPFFCVEKKIGGGVDCVGGICFARGWIVGARLGLERGVDCGGEVGAGARLECGGGMTVMRRYRNCIKRRCGKKFLPKKGSQVNAALKLFV